MQLRRFEVNEQCADARRALLFRLPRNLTVAKLDVEQVVVTDHVLRHFVRTGFDTHLERQLGLVDFPLLGIAKSKSGQIFIEFEKALKLSDVYNHVNLLTRPQARTARWRRT